MANPINTGFDTEFSDPLNAWRAALAKQGIQTNIISGVRDTAKQAQLYYNYIHHIGGQGLAAPPGSSLHERGLAADVQPVNPADLPKMVALAKQFGIAAPYQAQGSHYDPYHFQLANWQQAEATQAPNTPWGTIPDTPTQYASNEADASTSGGGGFKIPGTTITVGGGAPTPGALAETGPENAGSNRAYNFSLPANAPMGMGNNNPLNIKYYKGAEKDYGGLIGPSSNTDQGDPQMKFSSPEAGWNAAYSLLNKKYGGGMTTPNQLIAGKGGWTPGNTDAAANVAKSAGIGPDDDIGFSDPDKAQKFMRALVTQEQGAAAKAYPDEMIAAAVGGNAPASAAPSDTAIASAAPGQRAADNQSLFGKFTQGPIDPATGKPTPGAVTPMAQIADAILNNTKNTQAKVDAAGPERTALSGMQAPMARNVSPMGGAMLPNVGQTYGQTLNSFARPLSYDASPPQAPQMAAAGFRGGFGPQAQGVSLNSLPPLPQGFPGQIRPLTLDEYGYQGAGYAS